MQRGSLIVLKNGVECRWRSHPSHVGAMVHTGAIYVRGVSRAIVAVVTRVLIIGGQGLGVVGEFMET